MHTFHEDSGKMDSRLDSGVFVAARPSQAKCLEVAPFHVPLHIYIYIYIYIYMFLKTKHIKTKVFKNFLSIYVRTMSHHLTTMSGSSPV